MEHPPLAVSQVVFNAFPESRLIKNRYDGKTYAVKDGAKRLIISEAALSRSIYKNDPVSIVNDIEFDSYIAGSDIK